jgi:flagellar basal-body rod modification protein FlgD
MAIDGTSSATSTAAAAQTQSSSLVSALGDNKGLDKNAFLKLLVAQMKNQDPLKPMDNTEFVAQLAQFSNLEQVMGINTRLDTLAAQGQGLQNTEISGLVGKTITINGKSVGLDGSGGAVGFGFSLDAPASDVSIQITDSSGKVIRNLDGGAHGQGLVKASWDGKNDAGVKQNAGAYTVTVTAKAANGAPVSVTQNGTGTVQSVSFEKGYPELTLDNGLSVPVSDLLSVSAPPNPTTTTTNP